MTSLVGIQCVDGVVIAADSSATFGDHARRTIEQQTGQKIVIVGNTNKLVIAGTGYVGHHQRFVSAVELANARKEFVGKSDIEISKHLAAIGVQDFSSTVPVQMMHNIPYSALVAFKANNRARLCEIAGPTGFQPELKNHDDFWFVSLGSAQSITDPFLALLREILWKDKAPNISGGIFTAYWALDQACKLNPGGVNYPIKISVYGQKSGSVDAWELSEAEILETGDLVRSAMDHFSNFKLIMMGENIPQSPAAI